MSPLPERSVAENSRPKDAKATKSQYSKKKRSGEDKKSMQQTSAASGRTARVERAPKNRNRENSIHGLGLLSCPRLAIWPGE